ncbi:hypothetical protein BP5796_04376 [Coleophoma crateriformis]|uniref:DUF2421 domain-containing protein n=1 Tax=Coleophoma crateriformis TaxID=565419 RepID=A0A3D8S954_9HELO|nr:hypothetical protein BP5796_04376 [Coleophoma crateriformis]
MDLEQMFLLFRAIFLPVSGLRILPKILVSLKDSWQQSEKISDLAKDYQGIATPMRRSLQSSAELVKIGIHHSLVTLGISPKPAKDDLENIGDTCAPGSKDFLFAFKLKEEEHQVQLNYSHWNEPYCWRKFIQFCWTYNRYDHILYSESWVSSIFGSCVIAIVTMNIILAYELQINKIGITVGESSGQPYYPIYLFAPYKVLCVIAGCFVALFWTVFPYHISARSKLRKILGSSLFILANFYSCMHTTVNVWIGHLSQEEQPDIQKLEVGRKILFSQEMSLITALRMHTNFTKYEPTLGGQFPRATYDGIISDVQSTVISMALMIQITKSLDTTVYKESWLCHLADMIEFTDFNAHSVTSLLCHLSAAVSNSCALPPYLVAPKSFPLIRKLRQLDNRLVDIKNAVDPTFAAFASLEVLSSIINSTLEHLISDVKLLVGEVNFEGFVKRKTRIEAKGGSEIKGE